LESLQEPVDAAAFAELEELVRALGEELSRFRKRALTAEGKLRRLEADGASADLFSADRMTTLEAENRELRARLELAVGRTRAMLDRVRFLRQQAAPDGAR
jgi:hypothetical protein